MRSVETRVARNNARQSPLARIKRIVYLDPSPQLSHEVGNNITQPLYVSPFYPSRPVVVVQRPHDSFWCPLFIFVLGFLVPFIWLLGCWYTESQTRTVRMLGQLSISMFWVTLVVFLIASFSVWDSTGKVPWASFTFPWEKGFKWPWDKS